MFELPQGEGIVEGVDDEHPIHLPDGITKDEFATLIRALCASGSVLYAFPPSLILVADQRNSIGRIIPDCSPKMTGCAA